MIELDGQIQQARPTIVARCESLQIAKKTVWLFERIHHLVDMDLGFDLLPWKDLIPSVHCLSGSRMRIETNNLGLPLNEATLGGFLVVDGRFCGLTVAHPFLDTRQESTAVLDGSDSDDESDWQEDLDRSQEDKVSNSEETVSPLFANGLSRLSIYKPGLDDDLTISPSSISSTTTHLYSAEGDWVLIWIRDASLLGPNLFVTPKGKIITPSQTSSLPPSGDVYVATNEKLKISRAFGMKCGLSLATSTRMQEAWMLGSATGW